MGVSNAVFTVYICNGCSIAHGDIDRFSNGICSKVRSQRLIASLCLASGRAAIIHRRSGGRVTDFF
ncbi:hypothetical protein SAMN05443582_10878 [Phyllobacterium sp. OV277]|nr:hypothetical protein SAMN05443582_10878 [Phyllobacterium sp. OV277]